MMERVKLILAWFLVAVFAVACALMLGMCAIALVAGLIRDPKAFAEGLGIMLLLSLPFTALMWAVKQLSERHT
jgi:F0F1-type ATP synthase membrane subunit c/vacuolar-type H+-ATPase subunit K